MAIFNSYVSLPEGMFVVAAFGRVVKGWWLFVCTTMHKHALVPRVVKLKMLQTTSTILENVYDIPFYKAVISLLRNLFFCGLKRPTSYGSYGWQKKGISHWGFSARYQVTWVQGVLSLVISNHTRLAGNNIYIIYLIYIYIFLYDKL